MSVTLSLLFGLLSAFGFGFATFFQKRSLEELGTYTALVLNYAFMILFLSLYVLPFQGVTLPTPETAVLLVVTVAIGTIAILCFFEALKRGKVSIIAPIGHASAAVAVILSFLFLGERLSLLEYLAITLTIIGAALVSMDLSVIKKLHWTKRLAKGVPLALITFFGWGAYHVLLKPIIDALGPYAAAWYAEGLHLLFFLIPLLFRKQLSLSRRGMAYAAGGGISIAFASVSLNLGISEGLVSVVSPLAATAPFIAAFLGYLFMGEKLEKNQYLALTFIMAGLILLSVSG